MARCFKLKPFAEQTQGRCIETFREDRKEAENTERVAIHAVKRQCGKAPLRLLSKNRTTTVTNG